MTSLPYLWLINATQDISRLEMVCSQALEVKQIIYVFYRASQRTGITEARLKPSDYIRFIELSDDNDAFPYFPGEAEAEVFFLPCAENIDWAGLQSRAPLYRPDCLQLLVPALPRFTLDHHVVQPIAWLGWRAPGPLARRILSEPQAWQGSDVDLIESIQKWPDPPPWQSIPVNVPVAETTPALTSPGPLSTASRVLVILSYFECEPWLQACLTSLAQQTFAPAAIAVIDDCSPKLPVDLLKAFPDVTLLSTTRNIGPEKILNNIIRATDYDAYMVQDPDDWCSCDRLEFSLRRAEETGAAMVGTSEFRFDVTSKKIHLCAYPLDVSSAMAKMVSHHLLHGTMLVARKLALEVGGLDEQLKLCADIDFAARAWHAGRVVNLPHYSYYRRVRPGSLTTRVDTGYKSRARSFEEKFVFIRASRNLDLVRNGQPPRIHVQQKEPVGFLHHQGPRLLPSLESQQAGALSWIDDKKTA